MTAAVDEVEDTTVEDCGEEVLVITAAVDVAVEAIVEDCSEDVLIIVLVLAIVEIIDELVVTITVLDDTGNEEDVVMTVEETLELPLLTVEVLAMDVTTGLDELRVILEDGVVETIVEEIEVIIVLLELKRLDELDSRLERLELMLEDIVVEIRDDSEDAGEALVEVSELISDEDVVCASVALVFPFVQLLAASNNI